MSNFLVYIEQLVANTELLALPLVFLAGMLLSFTPCCFSLIPVILGIAEIEEDTSRSKSFWISLIFVSGLVTVNIALGIASAMFGLFFGSLAKLFIVRLLFALMFVILGLVSLDVIHFNLKMNFNINTRRFGLLGVYLLGILCGISVTGCLLPVLGSVLLLIAHKKDVLYGIFSLCLFSLGTGSVYLLVAVFGREFFAFLDQRMHIMKIVKKLMGIVIISIGFYFLKLLFLG